MLKYLPSIEHFLTSTLHGPRTIRVWETFGCVDNEGKSFRGGCLIPFYLQAVHLQRNGNTPRTPCPLPCGRCHPSLGLSPVTNEPTENKKLLISAALM